MSDKTACKWQEIYQIAFGTYDLQINRGLALNGTYKNPTIKKVP